MGRDPASSASVGTTVFLTTHYLEEADALCDRLAIIDHGRIVAEGTSDELKQAVAGDVVTIGVDGPRAAGSSRLVEALPFVRESSRRGDGLVRLYVDRGEIALPQLLRLLDGAGLAPTSIALNKPSLDDVFLRQTGRSLREEPAAAAWSRLASPSTTKGPPMNTLRDTWLIFRRSLTLTLRQPVWIIFGLMQPILYLVLFGPLLDASVKAAGVGENAFNWFIPGLLIQTAVFGGAFVGFGLIAELRSGVVERMRVTPMSRIAMLFGRSLRDVVILVCQAILMMVVAIPFGLRIDLGGRPRDDRPARR